MKNFNFFLLLLVVFIGLIAAQEGGRENGVKQGDRDKQEQDKNKNEQNKDKQQGDKDKDKDNQQQDKNKNEQNKDKNEQNKDKQQDDKNKDKQQKEDKDKNANKDEENNKSKPDTSKINYNRDQARLELKEPSGIEHVHIMASFNSKIKFKWTWEKNRPPKTAETVRFTLESQETPSRPKYIIGDAPVMGPELEWTPSEYNNKENITEELKEGLYKLYIHDANKASTDFIKTTAGEFVFVTTFVLYNERLTPQTEYLFQSSSPKSVVSFNWNLASLTSIGLLAVIHYWLI